MMQCSSFPYSSLPEVQCASTAFNEFDAIARKWEWKLSTENSIVWLCRWCTKLENRKTQ